MPVYFQKWKDVGVEFLQLATTDIFASPCQEKLRKGVDFINKFISSNEISEKEFPRPSVYVHCKAGRTRSATLVACYLILVRQYMHF